MANDDTWHKLQDVKDQFADEGVYNLLQQARLQQISQKILDTVKELLNVDAFEMWFFSNQTVFVDYVQFNLNAIFKKTSTTSMYTLHCTLYELLNTNLTESEELHVSKSLTHQTLDLPLKFLYWADFYQLFEKFEECVKTMDTRYAGYIYSLNDAIRSHQTLVTKFKNLGDEIFAKRIFKDIIVNFDHRPNQDKDGVAYVGGVLPHDGDLFYVVSQNDSTNNSNSLFNSEKMIHLMEVKTRASLPIDGYKTTKQNYNWLLYDIYHGIKQHNWTNNDQDGKNKDSKDQNVIGLSKQRVNCLVSQMKKMMRSESNDGFTQVYSLLSTFEATFVLFYDNDEDFLWISRPLPREKLLLAMYLVLLIQLRQRNLYKDIPQDLLVILNDFETNSANFPTLPSESDSSGSSNSSTITQSSTNSSNNTTLNDTVIHSSLIAQSLSLIWKKGPKEMIGIGRTCFVVKVSYNNRLLALKMIYLYRNPKGSLEELQNEKEVMEWINLNTTLSIVPILHYYGNISLYRTLAMDYVDGECFHDFSEMTLPMIEACDKSVLELHKCRVLHGDLQPWNFILRRVKNTYKAHIIDFGRGRSNASADDLNTEYARFCIDANIMNRGMNPSANRNEPNSISKNPKFNPFVK